MFIQRTHKIDLKMKQHRDISNKRIKSFFFILSNLIKAQDESRKNYLLTDYGLRT